MRRKGNVLSENDTLEILKNKTNGVLAVHGDNGYPYAVPMSYAYANQKLYFHGAVSGHKLDAIGKNEKVSFCVVAADEIIPEEFNTLFRSAIAFGKIRVLEDPKEKMQALEHIVEKYSSKFKKEGLQYIEQEWEHCIAMEMTIEQLTGKAGD